AAYLNTAYFGSGHYGVVDGARGYFGVSVDKLTYPQAALLAALLRAPEGNNPSVSPENAKLARNRTLDAMLELDTISTAAHSFATATALPSTAAPIRPRTGSREIAPQFADTIVGDLVAKYGVRNALGGGLTVRTTLDAKLQRAANQAARQAAEVGLDAAVVTIDVATGELRAMAHGGDAARLAFNVALDGQRQPGSAFKPFMLAAAYEQGLAPGTTVESAPYDRTIDGTRFQVSNGGGYAGITTLERATWQSDNTVYARLQERLGIIAAIDVAHAAGIRSEIDPVPAAVLGALPRGTTPTELAHAYATFAGHGQRVSLVGTGGPRRIARVTDANGESWRPTAVRVDAIPAGVADLVTQTLQGVVRRGTGTAAAIGRPVAGKTGTTEDYRDAWFVGYTPGLVTAVWVGHAEGGIPMKTQNGGGAVTGGSIPARIWSAYMRAALEGQPIEEFDLDAPKFVSVVIDPDTGLLAGEWCAQRVTSSVIAGQQPTEPSTDCVTRTRPAPDLTGMSLEDARAALVEQEFLDDGAVSEELVTDPAQDGLVLRQDPAPGAPTARDERITLILGDDPFTD
ncbi:MAG: hypothetical protein JWM90_1433, partial [Thermoleophilia bacterium]|nr:hypothetical protein [Thermoleophilia bacterium]